MIVSKWPSRKNELRPKSGSIERVREEKSWITDLWNHPRKSKRSENASCQGLRRIEMSGFIAYCQIRNGRG